MDKREEMIRIGALVAVAIAKRWTANGGRIALPASEHEMLGEVAAIAMTEAGWTCVRDGMAIEIGTA
jgi:hypothetical protein